MRISRYCSVTLAMRPLRMHALQKKMSSSGSKSEFNRRALHFLWTIRLQMGNSLLCLPKNIDSSLRNMMNLGRNTKMCLKR